jgi:hypothetical protein
MTTAGPWFHFSGAFPCLSSMNCGRDNLNTGGLKIQGKASSEPEVQTNSRAVVQLSIRAF